MPRDGLADSTTWCVAPGVYEVNAGVEMRQAVLDATEVSDVLMSETPAVG